MGERTVNGEQPASHFLAHLTSYPVISDSIASFKSNKYGAKSLSYADQGYAIAKPYLPYFSTPYSYIAPYVAKADSLGDQGLTRVDEKFPIVKEDTDKIRDTLVDTARRPLRLAEDARHHLADTYDAEYKKCGGSGYVAGGKAVVTTSLVLSQESLAWLSNTIAAEKKHVKGVVNDKANH